MQMRRIVIFGNSGSGKSTLAKGYVRDHALAHLDLDILAWQNSEPPIRRPVGDSAPEIGKFLAKHEGWVVEGCYSDLLKLALDGANEAILLNPGVETCIANCKKRPWEPHKYPSAAAQDKNLDMLLDWVRQYSTRRDEFSLVAHQKLFDGFAGKKTEILSNDR